MRFDMPVSFSPSPKDPHFHDAWIRSTRVTFHKDGFPYDGVVHANGIIEIGDLQFNRPMLDDAIELLHTIAEEIDT
jgi:hypothetical protein